MGAKPLENKSTDSSRWVWFIAGPNGAGKSTWVKSSEHSKIIGSIPVLNPDLVVPNSNKINDFLYAGRQTISTFESYIDTKKSFAIETTLSGKRYLSKAKSLKENGWNVGCIYIGLNSVEHSIKRVQERHRNGGHNVPTLDIIRRYPRSIQNIVEMSKVCDYLAVFDNSDELQLLLEAIPTGIIIRKRGLPQWASHVIKQII